MKLPIQFEFQNKKVLFIGAGLSAYRHAKVLHEYKAQLTIISKAFHSRFSELTNTNQIIEILDHADLNTSYFDSTDLVIIGTKNHYLNKKIYNYCQEHRILNMTLDNSLPSDFKFMESISEKGITLATSIQGTNPGFEYDVLRHMLNSLDDDIFIRMEMLIAEQRTLRGLKH